MTVPKAAVSATPEPEIPPMMMPEMATTCAREPRIPPTMERAKAIMASVMPPLLMKLPASMKSGMAMSGKESMAVKNL